MKRQAKVAVSYVGYRGPRHITGVIRAKSIAAAVDHLSHLGIIVILAQIPPDDFPVLLRSTGKSPRHASQRQAAIKPAKQKPGIGLARNS